MLLGLLRAEQFVDCVDSLRRVRECNLLCFDGGEEWKEDSHEPEERGKQSPKGKFRFKFARAAEEQAEINPDLRTAYSFWGTSHGFGTPDWLVHPPLPRYELVHTVYFPAYWIHRNCVLTEDLLYTGCRCV